MEVFRSTVADLRLTGSPSVSDGRIYRDVMLVCCIGVCTGWVFVAYIKYDYVVYIIHSKTSRNIYI